MSVEDATAAHQKAAEEALQATVRLRKAQQAADDAAEKAWLEKALTRPPPRNRVKPLIL
jgi:hypothetical protein